MKNGAIIEISNDKLSDISESRAYGQSLNDATAESTRGTQYLKKGNSVIHSQVVNMPHKLLTMAT
jgi:hypothetical protein